MNIGTKLQQARIDSGFTLADIAQVTKMSSHVLQLIEANEFSRLPGGLLTRGYLRAFASEVGLDPEAIVNEYRAEFEIVPVEDEPFKLRGSYQEPEAGARRAAFALVIGLAAIVYFAFLRPTQRPDGMDASGTGEVAAVHAAAAISQAVAPAPHADMSGRSPVNAAASEGLQIELRPEAECWLSAVADGQLVLYRLMQEGERETINARDEILLRVGDAGALTYSINGGAGRSLGAPGEAVTVRITSDNLASWVTNEPSRPAADDI